jgi:hypothetical protein
MLCETNKQAANLSVHQDGGRPRTGFSEILEKEALPCHNEFPEAASVVHGNKVLCDTEILAECSPAKVGKL